MLTASEIEHKLLAIKPELAERFHVKQIGYFGSYAKGNHSENSDLDLLVEFSKPIGWSFFTLENFLEKNLGMRIDLVTKPALKERTRSSILNQVVYI